MVLCALAACGGDETAGPGITAPPSASPTSTAPAAAPSAGGAAGSAAPTAAAASNPAPANPPATPAAITPSAAAPAGQPPVSMPAAMNPAGGKKPAMDECGLHTQYPGDEYCILPPAADKGFQLHVGPTSYDKPEAKYVLQPGEENVVNMLGMSGNDKDVYYYFRQYRMRPGSHHVIISVDGRRIGGVQNLARDEPNNGEIAPEDQDVGLTLKAHSQMTANMHFYNYTEKPLIRELWVNYWYKDAGSVKEPAMPAFSMTGVTAAVAHSHVVIGATCPITGSGRALSLYGHRHLNNVRFSIWHTTSGKRDLVFEDYDSEHPGAIAFNSLAMNPAPNPMTKTMGGASGILSLKQGDTLDFECEIVNDTDKNFFGANEAADDEMCILIGDTVGAQVSAGCSAKAAKRIQ
jgi:hypothetical protein